MGEGGNRGDSFFLILNSFFPCCVKFLPCKYSNDLSSFITVKIG